MGRNQGLAHFVDKVGSYRLDRPASEDSFPECWLVSLFYVFFELFLIFLILQRRPRKASIPYSISPSPSSRAPEPLPCPFTPFRATKPAAGWIPTSAAPLVLASTSPPINTETSSRTTIAFFLWYPKVPRTVAIPLRIIVRSTVVSNSGVYDGNALNNRFVICARDGVIVRRG